MIENKPSFRGRTGAVCGLKGAPSFFCGALQSFVVGNPYGSIVGAFFCASPDFDDNLCLVLRKSQSGVVGLLSTHMDDILVCSSSCVCPDIIRLLTIRFGGLKPKDWGGGGTGETARGLEMARFRDGSATASQRSCFD